MFSLRYLHFFLCSLEVDILRVQRIIYRLFFYILNYPHRMVDKSALNENKSVFLFRNTGKTGLLPQYGSFISRIFPYQHFYTMEIGFFNLFLQYFHHISLLWKRSNFSSGNIILIFRARNFDLLVCFAPVVTCAT